MLYSKSLLLIYFIYSSLYLLVPSFQFILLPLLSPSVSIVCSLCMWVCFYFVQLLFFFFKFPCKMMLYNICLISLNIPFSKTIHIAANSSISLIFIGFFFYSPPNVAYMFKRYLAHTNCYLPIRWEYHSEKSWPVNEYEQPLFICLILKNK